LAAVIAAGHQANAASGRNERSVESVQSRTAGEPIMAVVSLRNQRITVYDANGWIVRAPVSSGQKGRETPAGIFSVIQKEAEHYSNLYDDAYMPHMQRITWSGIALHGGPLPGYPASHGCIRMPYDFAERLFDATKLGMRVIIAPSNVAPVEIAPPALFTHDVE
jgi:lipoprotein-anchoring transpeptidase ErfK/SrfK